MLFDVGILVVCDIERESRGQTRERKREKNKGNGSWDLRVRGYL